MNRRTFIAGFMLPLLTHEAGAQQTARVPRIGFLSPSAPSGSTIVAGFREGLRELGYVEGRNILVEYRWADGHFERLPGLAEELVRLDVDVIFAQVTQASLAARKSSGTIPIVMAGVADPVEVGLVASLAQPGGNVTGTAAMTAEIVGKQLELMREVDPRLTRLATLWNPRNPVFQALMVKQAQAAGRATGIDLSLFEVGGPDEFGPAFTRMREEGLPALFILSDPLFTLHWARLAALAIENRLATVSGNREFVEAGGLLAYGPSYFDAGKRAVMHVDRILKGARPADLPVEQPTKFELFINMRTARKLEVTVPASLLARADEVIE